MNETKTRWDVTSDEAQREFGPLLGSVIREQAHVVISSAGLPAAVLVPAGWYVHAKTLIESRTSPPRDHSTETKDEQ